MYVDRLECPTCRNAYESEKRIQLCECGSPLLVRYDLERVGTALDRQALTARPASLWRYRELLPVRDDGHIVSLGEGMTPLVWAPRLGGRFGFQNLYIKDEGNFVCPEGAATFAAARELLAQGWIKPEEEVVLLNTGTGLKYPQTVQAEAPLLKPGDELPVDG